MQNKNHLKNLAKIIYKLKSENEVFDFLNWILTPSEKKQITARLEIIKLLKEGIPQREIAKRLGVGNATVTRGSKEFQNNDKITKNI